MRIAGLLAVLALTACGGGGLGAPDPAADDPDGGPGTTPGSAEALVVVRYDSDGDGLLDVLTLDTSVSPFRIVEALAGTPDGDARDTSQQREGEAVPAGICTAIADHLADSYALGDETDLRVDVNGADVTVTVVE